MYCILNNLIYYKLTAWNKMAGVDAGKTDDIKKRSVDAT